jgi:N-acetylglucosaminyldiphosphoundecaprenol N-acetyl-beta-D-mannosaminyltransferase
MPLSIEAWPIDRSRAVVFNTEAAWYFLESAAYRSDVRGATHVYCDGAGLAAYAQRRFGRPVARLHGPDVMRGYLQHADGRKVLLFGGSPEAHAGLRAEFPDFFARNAVAADTRMLAAEAYANVAAEVAAGGYDDVLIFLGLLRQERFQALLHAAGHAGASIGLGAAIDFLSGTKPRSGRLWQVLGLEWLPRLAREPRMLPRVGRSFALFPRWRDACNAELESFLFGETQASVER